MTLDWSRATVLTATAFEACWEILRLGETPWQLDPPRQGSTAEARRVFVADVLRCVQAAGPELDVALRLLARPAWSLDVRLRADSLVAGIAACRGSTGVLAVRHGDAIALLDIAAADAASAVLSLLGPVRPGPGRPTTLALDRPAPETQAVTDIGSHDPDHPLTATITGSPARDPRSDEHDVQRKVQRDVGRHDPDHSAHPLTATVAGHRASAAQAAPRGSPILGGDAAASDSCTDVQVACRDVHLFGQLGAAVATHDGLRMRRLPRVIGFHRTSGGDYRSVRVDRSTVALEPATRARLAADLDGLLAAVRGVGDGGESAVLGI